MRMQRSSHRQHNERQVGQLWRFRSASLVEKLSQLGQLGNIDLLDVREMGNVTCADGHLLRDSTPESRQREFGRADFQGTRSGTGAGWQFVVRRVISHRIGYWCIA